MKPEIKQEFKDYIEMLFDTIDDLSKLSAENDDVLLDEISELEKKAFKLNNELTENH